MKVRGSATQVLEKYLAMARDATAAGDRIAAENYFQHAEHYYRILSANAVQAGQPARPPQNPQQGGYSQGGPQNRPTPAQPDFGNEDGEGSSSAPASPEGSPAA